MHVEFLLLADRAETLNGKLYMMGAGFDRVGITQIPGQAVFDLAVGFMVEYTETNQPHAFMIRLEDEDNHPVGPAVSGDLEVGRPPGSKPGQGFRTSLAIRGPFPIPKAGAYAWAVRLGDQEVARTRFYVDLVQLPQAQQPSA